MPIPIDEQVIDFFHTLFEGIFSTPFKERIRERLRRNAVIRQIEEAADAASQSLARFFVNERLTESQVNDILQGFSTLGNQINLDSISNPNVMPETLVETLLIELQCPEPVRLSRQEATYRVALHTVIQVLMQVGPVMAEWQKLNFSSTFELPRRVVNRLNQISEQINASSQFGQEAADERYELSYRDYLLQRFHRIEAGTVRMTTNLDTDLRELFVMPRVKARTKIKTQIGTTEEDLVAPMNLRAARRIFTDSSTHSLSSDKSKNEDKITALEQIRHNQFNVLIGAPGGGKSTFLEWLQVKLASVEEEFVLAGRQAIPLLLRVRQLDPHNLPHGASLIEKATASKDRAALMPLGWTERQMKAGRVFFMLDGLDETEPEMRDQHLLPWLTKLCNEYPNCHYLVSSRPVGYPPEALRSLQFVECDLLDFNPEQMRAYTQHWCTAVRLAQNEPEQEARREGAADGDRIMDGFSGHAYIRNLARNPLMLSAICLVNYFEGGHLPQDRALLYKLCVEGLLHHWDQRRGIRSEFAFEEKLRVCREVALAMQINDRAEYEADQVQQAIVNVIGDRARARKLFEHIRYRTGILLERRPNMYAFAHLTFQEYLAARAIYEGNQAGMDIELLIREHSDGRWQEVVALYCSISPTPITRNVLEHLIAQQISDSSVLAESYLSSGPEIWQDKELKHRLLEKIACSEFYRQALNRFPTEEVALIANNVVGNAHIHNNVSEAFVWLFNFGGAKVVDISTLYKRFDSHPNIASQGFAELVCLLHKYGSSKLLINLANRSELYILHTDPPTRYNSLTMAIIGFCSRRQRISQGTNMVFIRILRSLLELQEIDTVIDETAYNLVDLIHRYRKIKSLQNTAIRHELALLSRKLLERLTSLDKQSSPSHRTDEIDSLKKILNAWANSLEIITPELFDDMTQIKPKSKISKRSSTTANSKSKEKANEN